MRIFPPSILWELITAWTSLCLAVLMVASLGCTQRDPAFLQGEEIYKAYCITCHGLNGGGVLYEKSALNNNAFVTGDPAAVITVILYGRRGSGTMPSWQMRLNDQEVAAVATYIRQDWSNQAEPVTVEMVKKIRTKGKKISQLTQSKNSHFRENLPIGSIINPGIGRMRLYTL